MADGWITIGTELSTDKFDKQINELQKKMKTEEDKKIVIGSQLQTQKQEFDMAIKKTDELANAYQRLKKITSSPNEFKAGYGEYGQITSKFGNLEQIERSFNSALSNQDKLEQKLMQTELRYQNINNKVSEYKNKIESVKLEKQVNEVNRMKDSFNNVGSSIQNAITRVGKLAIGIFGIRSAYMALRRASSDLASYDEQYATNLEYIRYALTQAIAPVLRWIVSTTAKILGYINMLLKGLFGIDLFSRGSAENFNKMKAKANGVSKAVEKIRKQLAGFDEINMLTDQSDTGTSAGAKGVSATVPEFDLSSMQGETPEWMKWILQNKDLVIAGLVGIAAAIVVLKAGLGGLMALGIGIAVAGIVKLIQDIIKFIKNPTWENFVSILGDLALVLAGVAIAMIAFNATNPIGWITLLVAGIIALVAVIIKYWDQIKAVFLKVAKWIYDYVIKPIVNFFKEMWKNIKNVFAPVGNWFSTKFKDAYNKIKLAFSNVKLFFQGVWDKIKSVFTGIGQTIGNAVGDAFKTAVNAVFRILEGIVNMPIKAINGLISIINAVPRNKFRIFK